MAKLDTTKTNEMRKNITTAFDEYILPLTEQNLTNEEWLKLEEFAKDNAFDKFCCKIITEWYLTNQFDNKDDALKEALNTTELSEINDAIESSNAKKMSEKQIAEESKKKPAPKKKGKLSLKGIGTLSEENTSGIIENYIGIDTNEEETEEEKDEEEIEEVEESIEEETTEENNKRELPIVEKRFEVDKDAKAYMVFELKDNTFIIPNYSDSDTFVEEFVKIIMHDFAIPSPLEYYILRDVNKMLEIYEENEGCWMELEENLFDELSNDIKLDTKEELIKHYEMKKYVRKKQTVVETETTVENVEEETK